MSEYELVLFNNTTQPVLITDQDIFGEGSLQKKFQPNININGAPNYAKAVSSGIIQGSFKAHIGTEVFDCSFTYDGATSDNMEPLPTFEVTPPMGTEGVSVVYNLVPQPPLLHDQGLAVVMVIITESPPSVVSGYSIKIMNKTSQKLIVADEDSEIKWEEVFHYEENNDGPYDVVSAKAVAVDKPVKGFFQFAIGSDAVFNCHFSFESGKANSAVFTVPSSLIRQYILNYTEPQVNDATGVANIEVSVTPISTFEITIVNKTSQDLEILEKTDNFNIASQIGSHITEIGLASDDGALNGSFVISVLNVKFTCTFAFNIDDPRFKPLFKVLPKSANKVSATFDKPTCINDMASVTLNITSK